MVRASDCGPEGHRFNPGIPPHAGIVQWLVCKFSKLEMRVRFSLPAPAKEENENLFSFYFLAPVREGAECLPAPWKAKNKHLYLFFGLFEDDYFGKKWWKTYL